MTRLFRARIFSVGLDGLISFTLSNIAIVASGGLSLMLPFRKVHQTACRTSTVVNDVDWILVLGMRLVNGEVSKEYMQRLNRAITLHHENPQSRIVILGGRKKGGSDTEANKGKAYLLEHGLNPDCVIPENYSSNTYENLWHAKADVVKPDRQSVVIVTNRFHMARTHAIASYLELGHQLCAAESQFALMFWHFLQEAYYLHWFVVARAWRRLVAAPGAIYEPTSSKVQQNR
ncbi:MAG: hypothetical protein BMS9Abin33_0395 [Gammaproteobacteria bacterium]|nr:MAG: hypothetical protein BMS9Abin33_0395 [Gammaproteobacteria bacterium]